MEGGAPWRAVVCRGGRCAVEGGVPWRAVPWMVAGTNEGICGFCVRVRNDDLTVAKGVTIQDMGKKFGQNGY